MCTPLGSSPGEYPHPMSAADAARSVVTLYTKPDCHLCEEARKTIEEVRAELSFELVVLDITLDEQLHRAYFERIPVVSIDGEELFEYFVDAERLRDALERSSEAPEPSRGDP